MLDLTSAPPGVDLWFRFPLSLFRYLSFLRNNLCRFLLYYPAYVERDYEEDHYGSDADASEDG